MRDYLNELAVRAAMRAHIFGCLLGVTWNKQHQPGGRSH